MSTWPTRDILVIIMLFFNLGGMIWTVRYMFTVNKHQFDKIEKDLTNLFARMAGSEKVHARIEGILEMILNNGKKK